MSIIRSDSIKNLAGTKEVSVNQLAGLIDTTIPNIEQDIADNTQGISDAMLSIENNKLRVLSVKWEPSRDIISVGDSACDGQLLSRSLYPDAWAAIDAGLVPVIDDATWLADPLQRGKFSRGDGTTTFRLPDYNGKQPGSIGAVFQRGDGALSAAVAGAIQLDELKTHTHGLPGNTSAGGTDGSLDLNTGSTTATSYNTYSSGGNETRPLNVTGVWVIRLFGSVVNVGLADAAELATAYGAMATRITAAEADLAIFEQKLLSGNGYQKMKGGLIIQWGATSAASNTFPIAFPNACIRIIPMITNWNTTGAIASQYYCITARSVSGFTLVAAAAPYTLEWIAIGY